MFVIRLFELGAQQIANRHDVDAEDRQVINEWFSCVLSKLGSVNTEVKLDYLLYMENDDDVCNGPTREQPFNSVLKVVILSL